jgi:hypothetical protein
MENQSLLGIELLQLAVLSVRISVSNVSLEQYYEHHLLLKWHAFGAISELYRTL